jgi:hypothetical protein
MMGAIATINRWAADIGQIGIGNKKARVKPAPFYQN